jgi:hypothetical protein
MSISGDAHARANAQMDLEVLVASLQSFVQSSANALANGRASDASYMALLVGRLVSNALTYGAEPPKPELVPPETIRQLVREVANVLRSGLGSFPTLFGGTGDAVAITRAVGQWKRHLHSFGVTGDRMFFEFYAEDEAVWRNAIDFVTDLATEMGAADDADLVVASPPPPPPPATVAAASAPEPMLVDATLLMVATQPPVRPASPVAVGGGGSGGVKRTAIEPSVPAAQPAPPAAPAASAAPAGAPPRRRVAPIAVQPPPPPSSSGGAAPVALPPAPVAAALPVPPPMMPVSVPVPAPAPTVSAATNVLAGLENMPRLPPAERLRILERFAVVRASAVERVTPRMLVVVMDSGGAGSGA